MTDDLSARLLRAVLRRPGRARISLIGLCKNAGKTVTLNRLIRAAAAEGLTPGLLSTGRDGEAVDAVTELPKPRIWAPAGALVATALPALTPGGESPEGTWDRSGHNPQGGELPPGDSHGSGGTAAVEVLAETGIPTPLGPVVIGRVVRSGAVLLVGPGSAARVGALLDALEAAGAALCLVDGSFDRRAAAAPAVTGRAVLAAGAAYSASVNETVAQVRHLLEIFDLPAAPADWLNRGADALPPVALLPPEGPPAAVPVASALTDSAAVAEAAAAAPPGTVLSLGGALTDGLLMALLARRLGGLPILVDDPTRVLAGRTAWRRWRRQGGRVWVRRGIDLAAVTTNAYSPVGPDYDPADFCARVAEVAGRPVADLVAGIAHNLNPED
ncbi:hypothetical protein J2Z79_003450 [Symbiobacterium terraclitae]|uniref:Mur ligase central domain-containing protein n=1 Tax=Symbiobacterium terraclitae TaxID=557451 RepID=A0ABS4JWU2_9FIRM|nr:hypothetical protein [Symbiobacterium terraclitae]MBP2020003.1 hypothetical protein [Symbiobacterium terraclitae]